jgi:hypothetical protein
MFVTFLGFLGDYAPLSFGSTGIVAMPEDLQGNMECLAWVMDRL